MTPKKPRPYLFVIVTLLSVLGLVFVCGPRIQLGDYKPQPIALQEPLDDWLANQEAAVPQLRPELRKTIMWHNPSTKQRTPLALVYLHGFSASHREIYPVMERLSQDLAANVYLARLRGHGQDGPALGKTNINEWLQDVTEAFAIGSEIGEQVVVIGTSTGGSLGVWLAATHPQLKGLVLLSPNFGPKDKRSELMLLPWGPVVAKAVVGATYGLTPKDGWWNRNFTPEFPTEGLFPMMAAVSLARSIDGKQLLTPTLVLYTKKDPVIDALGVERFYNGLGSPKKQLIDLPDATGHILAGEHVSPQTTDSVVRLIVGFIKSL